jgi:hypothetical protein
MTIQKARMCSFKLPEQVISGITKLSEKWGCNKTEVIVRLVVGPEVVMAIRVEAPKGEVGVATIKVDEPTPEKKVVVPKPIPAPKAPNPVARIPSRPKAIVLDGDPADPFSHKYTPPAYGG